VIIISKNSWVEKATERAQAFLENNKDQSVANRLDHLERTRRRALAMAKKIHKEKNVEIDYDVLQLAALLHDIDETYEHDSTMVERSARKAEEILREIGFPEDKAERVITIISEHSSEKPTPSTSIESDIVYDADKLDGLGAIGITRVFALSGQKGWTQQQGVQFYRKKIDIALPAMRTDLGRKLCDKRLKMVNKFLENFEKEQRRAI
jgi:uncharacterized protein